MKISTYLPAVLLVAAVILPASGLAQELSRFDVICSSPVRDSDGSLLPGSNPTAADFGFPVIPGALVQLIDAGSNGTIDLPHPNGSPGGDDAVFGTTFIGQGIAPNLSQSGKFSMSFYPSPSAGAKVYIRVFNTESRETATRWGQSNLHTVSVRGVFDASIHGMQAATLPLGTDPVTTDSDSDGMTDFEELVANTNADDAEDVLRAETQNVPGGVEVDGRAGRHYRLMRSTDTLTETMTWQEVAASDLLEANEQILLLDPAPPEHAYAFYRVEAVIP